MKSILTHWKKITLAALILAVAAGAYVYYQLSRPLMTPERLMALKKAGAAQNETALAVPPAQQAVYPKPSQDRNVYFGDLHVHSSLSFDSYIFQNRWSPEDAYRFAQGGVLKNPAGEKMQLTRPLDFVAITDHAESFSFPSLCAMPAAQLSRSEARMCNGLENPTARLFLQLRATGERRPMKRLGQIEREKAIRLEDDTWAHIVALADKHNRPGRFTTFPAYEYSPPLPDTGKHHRNVIFKNGTVPRHAVSAFDAAEAPDLWRALRQTCTAPCEVLTIPHNPNKSWGLAFADVTIDGRAYTPEDWALREAMEPLVEMIQIKGASECALGLGTSDEECGFEQFLPVCAEGQTVLCIHPTSMIRDGLKKGLRLQETLGYNPLDFGLIGSTDTHNANPGDAEEWDYRGAAGVLTAAAQRRLLRGTSGRYPLQQNPGGLAAIWAEENTREALFAAMRRKEVYATSGTRIALRFYGGFNDMAGVLRAANPARLADRLGVPMGAYMKAGTRARPEFFVWALRDPSATALDKVQIIKSWVEDGETKERVLDIACAENRSPDENGKCAPLKAKIDITNCAPEAGRGAEELKTLWRDETYQADQKAFYYVRVLQVESCRWSQFDAIRAGVESYPPLAPKRLAERAWSSPIFVGGQGR